ncbi:MAG: Crp/Fnr family transcriptional regulator [Pseudomonadota bacterium]
MSLASDIAVLRRVPFFEPLDEEQLRLLAFGGENLHFKTGEVLFQAGETSIGGLVIVSGDVILTQQSRAGHEERMTVATLLGQRALITETARRHTATAAGPVEVLLVRRSLFMRMLSEFPAAAATLRNDIANELRSLTDQASTVVNRPQGTPGKAR